MKVGRRRWIGFDGYGDCAPAFLGAGQRVLPRAYRASPDRGKASAEMVQEAHEVLVFQSARILGGTFPFRAARYEGRRDGLGGAACRHCADDVYNFHCMMHETTKSPVSIGIGLFSFSRIVCGTNLWYNGGGGKGVLVSI